MALGNGGFRVCRIMWLWKHLLLSMKCRFGNHENEVMNDLMLSQWSVSAPGWGALREQTQILARFWWHQQWVGSPRCQKWVGTGKGSVGRTVLMHQKCRVEDWLSPKQLWLCLLAQLWLCSECTADQLQQFMPSDQRCWEPHGFGDT